MPTLPTACLAAPTSVARFSTSTQGLAVSAANDTIEVPVWTADPTTDEALESRNAEPNAKSLEKMRRDRPKTESASGGTPPVPRVAAFSGLARQPGAVSTFAFGEAELKDQRVVVVVEETDED